MEKLQRHFQEQLDLLSEKILVMGGLVECDRTDKIFTAPTEKLTEDYVTGRFG